MKADLIYTLNGGERYEEWYRIRDLDISDAEVTATLPEGTTHYYLNLIDENSFLRSYPEVEKSKENKGSFIDSAVEVK